MRILRFNESNSRKPKKVSSEEFMEKRRDHRMVDFTSTERKRILEILNARKSRDFNFHYSMNSDFVEIFSISSSTEIIRLDDYWFTINRSDRYGGSEYFICDDVEELYWFLEKEWY